MSRALAFRLLEVATAAVLGVAAGRYMRLRRHRRSPRPRVREFAASQTGTVVSFSNELVLSAQCLLRQSLDERKQEVWREQNNHAASYAPGAITMIVTALDAWLNEIVGDMRSKLSEDRIAELVEKPTWEKYRELGRELSGNGFQAPRDLKLLIDLRNEIVHPLPYAQLITPENTIPDRLAELQTKGLLISTANPNADFHLSQKLCSYALGYWAFQKSQAAVQALTPILDNGATRALAQNFALFEQVTAPSDLGTYDKRFGLNLTR